MPHSVENMIIMIKSSIKNKEENCQSPSCDIREQCLLNDINLTSIYLSGLAISLYCQPVVWAFH